MNKTTTPSAKLTNLQDSLHSSQDVNQNVSAKEQVLAWVRSKNQDLPVYDESWTHVRGYEGEYQISNYGRVASYDRTVRNKNGTRFVKGKVLKQQMNTHGYPAVSLCKEGKCRTFPVHRLMKESWNLGKGNVDHIDQDKTNNHLSNLRIATKSQNGANQPSHKGNSQYKGVMKQSNGKWLSYIKKDQKQIKLGIFDKEEEAAMAYDNKARILFGAFACLNFPHLPND